MNLHGQKGKRLQKVKKKKNASGKKKENRRQQTRQQNTIEAQSRHRPEESSK